MAAASPFPVEIIVTPRYEVFYALYALESGGDNAYSVWRDQALERLPREYKVAAKRVAPAPLFWPLLADALRNAPGELSFDQIIAVIRTLDEGKLQRNVLTGLLHDDSAVEGLLTGKRTLKSVITSSAKGGNQLLKHFALAPYRAGSDAVKAVSSLIDDPHSFQENVAAALNLFWSSGFSADWEGLQPDLNNQANRLRKLHGRRPLTDFATEINLPVTFDIESGVVRSRSGFSAEFENIECAYLIPSAFNSRRWWAKYEKEGPSTTLYFPYTLYFPLYDGTVSPNVLVSGARQAAPRFYESAAPEPVRAPRLQPRTKPSPKRNVDAETVFRALGDTTRFAIASILARTPTSSAELARKLDVSKPTITHHVQLLRAAGLITEISEGQTNRLTLDRDAIESLSDAAVDQLFASSGELSLETTRKRAR